MSGPGGGEASDRNARAPGPILRALARIDGGPPGRLTRILPGSTALRTAHAVARGLPLDPLAAAGRPASLDVMIPYHPKDFRTARIAVASVRRHLDGIADDISVVMPDGADAPAWLRRADVHVRHDSGVLDAALPDGSADRAAITDGFRTQMALKWAVPLASMRPTLVLDADTVLLQPRTWLVGGVQLLDCRAKHQPRFDGHTTAFLGGRPGRLPSFVTHHQVVQPDLLLDLLGRGPDGGPAPGALARWLATNDDLTPSEYQAYGALAVTRHPDRVRPTRWANTTYKVHRQGEAILPPANLTDEAAEEHLSELEERLPTSASVTFHHRVGR